MADEKQVLELTKKIRLINQEDSSNKQTNQSVVESEDHLAPLKENFQWLEPLISSKFTRVSDQITVLINESNKVSDVGLKQSILHTAKALAYHYLNNRDESEKSLKRSMKFLEVWTKENSQRKIYSTEELKLKIVILNIQGFLSKETNKQEAIKTYTDAFHILQNYPQISSLQPVGSNIIDHETFEFVHQSLIDLLSTDISKEKLRKRVEQSLIQHRKQVKQSLIQQRKQVEQSLIQQRKQVEQSLYAQLESFLNDKNWEAADQQTNLLMLNIAKREEQGYLDYEDINSFSCRNLQRIDQLWVNADKRFGFSVQKKIWIITSNRLDIKPNDLTDEDQENYRRFVKAVGWDNDKMIGWYDDKMSVWIDGKVTKPSNNKYQESYDQVIERIKDNSNKGGLPLELNLKLGAEENTIFFFRWFPSGYPDLLHQAKRQALLFSRVAACKL